MIAEKGNNDNNST